MKTLIFVSVFALFSGFIYSQNTSDKGIFDTVETGSRKFYDLKTKDGNIIHARIVSVDKNQVLLMNSDGNSLTVKTEDIIAVEKKEFQGKGSLGLGFGIPYGFLGANLDVPVFKSLCLSGGIGTGIFVTPMYSAGCKLYLRSGNYKWRPRISGYYGSTGFLYLEEEETTERFHSTTLGIGQQWSLGISKSIGFDFDILYIVDDSKLEKRVEELENSGYSFNVNATGNFKISIGLDIVSDDSR